MNDVVRPAQPSFGASVVSVTRLASMRLRRSRRSLIGVITLGLLVVALGASRQFGDQTATDAWTRALDVGLLGFASYLLPFLFLSTAFSDEHDDRTLPFLLVRPVSRGALLLGKFAAGTFVSLVVGLASVLLLYGASYLGAFDLASGGALGKALLAMALLIIGHSAIAMMWSVLAPEGASALTVVHFGMFELGLKMLPGVFPMASMHAHAERIAGTIDADSALASVSPWASAGAILGPAVFFLALGLLGLATREYRFARS